MELAASFATNSSSGFGAGDFRRSAQVWDTHGVTRWDTSLKGDGIMSGDDNVSRGDKKSRRGVPIPE